MAIGSKSNRGRPYGMLLLLAFGAAVFGVMMLHKMRERRLFNLLIKDKDRELLSLQLLLQKERDVAKEMKGKIEDLKTKSVAVRSQKMWLTNKLTEMESTIASLRKEQRTMESALKEKDKKINALTDMNAAQGNLQVTTTTELLKQKDIIKKMKCPYEKPSNIWSVSTDDPSNPVSNLTMESVPAKVEDEVVVSEDGQMDNTAISQHGEALVKRGDDGDKNAIKGGDGLLNRLEGHQDGEIFGGREITGEKNATEGEEKGKYSVGLSKMLEASQSSDGMVRKQGKGPRNVTEGNEQRVLSINGQSGVVEVKERGVYRDGKRKKLENAQVGALKERITISNNEKLEMHKDPQKTASSRMRGEHGYRTMVKNNRRRAISTNGELEKRNARHNENTKLNGENGDTETMEGESHDVIPRDKDPGKTVNSQEKADSRRGDDGDRSVLGGLLRSDAGAVAKNGWLKMPDKDTEDLVMRGETGDQRTLEGDFDPNDGQQEMPVKSDGEDSRMMTGNENKNATRIEDEEKTAVEGIEEQSGPSNGQLEIAEHSLVSGKNTSENEKEETSGDVQKKFLRNSQDTDNLRMRKENGDINALEGKESEVVFNDRQLELTANSQGGEQVYNVVFEHQEENAILKKQQSHESQNAQEIKAMRIRDEASDPNEVEENQLEIVSENGGFGKESENEISQNGEGLTAERENAVLPSVASEPEKTGIDSSINKLENLIDAVDDPNIIHEAKFIKKNNRQKRVKKGSVVKARLEN